MIGSKRQKTKVMGGILLVKIILQIAGTKGTKIRLTDREE